MSSKALLILFVGISTVLAVPAATSGDERRQAGVAKRGAEVMPFDLKATTHIFTKTPGGGVQRVVAKNPGDARQIELIRMHLREIREQFANGNYSAPSRIHGNDMPGLPELQMATPGAIKVTYQDVKDGAEIRYSAKTSSLVSALHRWFDAQLADHGTDAMAGHDHSSMRMH